MHRTCSSNGSHMTTYQELLAMADFRPPWGWPCGGSSALKRPVAEHPMRMMRPSLCDPDLSLASFFSGKLHRPQTCYPRVILPWDGKSQFLLGNIIYWKSIGWTDVPCQSRWPHRVRLVLLCTRPTRGPRGHWRSDAQLSSLSSFSVEPAVGLWVSYSQDLAR
jgi:hypothetical protein